MLTRFHRLPIFVAIVLLAVVSIGFGQTVTSTLTGTVSDASGAAVPNAALVLTNQLSGDVRRTTTNAAGYYTLPAIPASTYSLSVESSGFQKSEMKGIVLNAGDSRNVDMRLQVGAVTESVEVAAGVEQVAINTGEKSQVLDSETLQSIAIVGRSSAEFLKIMPGMRQLRRHR